MNHIKVAVACSTQGEREVMIAMLADEGYDGFEESDNELIAYIAEEDFKNDILDSLLPGIKYTTEVVPQQNWNALWESNFEPVVVDDFCTVRAHFHDITVTTPYEIVITPKMSFGTGHHATTRLVMAAMSKLDFKDKSVFDFGTGTGILAILAEMLGARQILAIDNDEWAIENSRENVERNNCTKITATIGSLENVTERGIDIILANINRNILLQYMSDMHKLLDNNGSIIMSGLLIEDEEIITKAAMDVGFRLLKCDKNNNWIALSFMK